LIEYFTQIENRQKSQKQQKMAIFTNFAYFQKVI